MTERAKSLTKRRSQGLRGADLSPLLSRAKDATQQFPGGLFLLGVSHGNLFYLHEFLTAKMPHAFLLVCMYFSFRCILS